MEISFGNKGIYHYIDAKIGSIRELEEKGYLYRVKMLVENELPYILPSSFISSDGEVWLSHNTESCYGLQAMLQQKKMTGDWLKKILYQIVRQAKMLDAYLLDASDLVLRIEYLFFHKEKNEIRMLCIPGYQKSLKEQLALFLEYLMPRFDHQDREGEHFLYACHQVLMDEWSDLPVFFALFTEVENPNSRVLPDALDASVVAPKENSGSADGDFVLSKRFFLYVLGGGAALALIIKYLFFDGTTGTAIFGVAWLLALVVLAIMTVRDKEEKEESDDAMREYKINESKVGEVVPSVVVKQEEANVELLSVSQQTGERKDGMKLIPLSNGSLEPFCIPMGREVFTVGRDKTSDYRVTTTQISRVHVRLFCRPDGLYIEDQNSTNGTYINMKRIPAMTEQKLEKGDVVGLANEEFFVA